MAKSKQPPPRPAPRPKAKPPAKGKKGKGRLILWLLVLGLGTLSYALVVTAGAEQVKQLGGRIGGIPQALGVVAGVFGLVQLVPAIWLSRKLKGGMAWLLLFGNLALLGGAYGAAPLQTWLEDRGAQVPALLLGQENYLVKEVLQAKLSWGLGSDAPSDATATTTTEGVERPARELPLGANDTFNLNLYEELLRDGHQPDVARYVERFPEALSSELEQSPAGIRVAVRKGNVDLVQYLLNKGVKLDKTSGLLLNAARINPRDPRKAAMLRLLLSKGVDPNETGKQGSALHFIQDERQVEVLLKAGTRLDHVDQDGRTALHALAKHDRPHCAMLLLRSGAELEAMDNFGRTPLYYAGNNPRVVAVFLSWRADVYQSDKNQKTAKSFIADELAELKSRTEHKDEADRVLTEFKIAQHQKSLDFISQPKEAKALVEALEEGPVRRYQALDQTYSAEFPVEPRQHPYEMVTSVTVPEGRFSIGAKSYAGDAEALKKAKAEMAKQSGDSDFKEFEVAGYPAVRTTREGSMRQWIWVGDTLYLALASHASAEDMTKFLDSFQLHPEHLPAKGS